MKSVDYDPAVVSLHDWNLNFLQRAAQDFQYGPRRFLQNTPQLWLSVLCFKRISTTKEDFQFREEMKVWWSHIRRIRQVWQQFIPQFVYFCHGNDTSVHCHNGTRLSSLLKLAFLCVFFAVDQCCPNYSPPTPFLWSTSAEWICHFYSLASSH